MSNFCQLNPLVYFFLLIRRIFWMFPSSWMFWRAIALLKVWSTADWMEAPRLKIASILSRNSTAVETLTCALCPPCECSYRMITLIISYFILLSTYGHLLSAILVKWKHAFFLINHLSTLQENGQKIVYDSFVYLLIHRLSRSSVILDTILLCLSVRQIVSVRLSIHSTKIITLKFLFIHNFSLKIMCHI